jgi:Carboxypeptidase regulatory-like domain
MRKAFPYNMTLLATGALLAGLTSTSFAQSDLASVNGVVRDASGAVIPNANVTLRNQDTGAERKTTTSAAGSYTITSLPAGFHPKELAHLASIAVADPVAVQRHWPWFRLSVVVPAHASREAARKLVLVNNDS